MSLGLRSRSNAMLALVAILLQIVSTFGHIHLSDRAAFAFTAQATQRSAQQAASLVSDAVLALDASPALPANDGDALCPLCLIGNLVASGVVASAPVLADPLVHALIELPIPVSQQSIFDIQTRFWSRGPPTS